MEDRKGVGGYLVYSVEKVTFASDLLFQMLIPTMCLFSLPSIPPLLRLSEKGI